MSEKDRIKKIIEMEGNNSSTFADTIGISRSSMNHILNGRNNPSLDVMIKILSKYVNINSDWLIMGKPPMYKGEKAFLQPTLFDEIKPDQYISEKVSEYPKENEIRNEKIAPQSLPVEEIIQNKSGVKKIVKIMIFYNDNTFESFAPDNLI